jgi:FkbM family methyltransferase
VVENRSELCDLLSRAAWFLTFSSIEKIIVPVSDIGLTADAWQVAPGMDPVISERFASLQGRVEFAPVSSEAELAPLVDQASRVLRWRRDSRPGWLSAATASRSLDGKKVVNVDPAKDRYEGSFYIDISRELMPDRDAVIGRGRARLAELRAELGRFDRAHVLATGPSVSAYQRIDFERTLNIVCNTVILDRELMAKVRPQFLVYADPVFHFGPSQYAGAFREAVRGAAAEFDFTICLPLKYHAVATAALPELADRMIAVPFRKDREFNFDLVADFELRTTANILTFLMLPLATTFAETVGILGCDGRPLKEDTYFWKHGSSTQLTAKMANIRQVHPAFFEIAYNDYYLEHCETLEAQLQRGEEIGKRFECLAPSHIPALSDRTVDAAPREPAATAGASRPTKTESRPEVVLIDPDALDWSGHFMAYNHKLTAALERRGSAVKVLCNRALDPEILGQRPSFLPLLSTHSWKVGNKFATKAESDRCERELSDAITGLVGDRSLVAYMYTGAVEHAAILSKLVARYSSLHAHVNLFWSAFHAHRWDEWVARYRETLQDLARVNPRLHVTVPTTALQGMIAEASGAVFEVAPHPSTAVADDDFPSDDLDHGTQATPWPLRVVFPGLATDGKGFERSLTTAERLAADTSLQVAIRYRPRPGGGTPHAAAVASLPASVEVVHGDLDDQAFRGLFSSRHLSVLPYNPAAFANRTSGLLIDSIYHGLPVVAVRGTWLGDVVERYGCGVVAADDSPERLVRAVDEAVATYPTLVGRTRAAARGYFAENSWDALAGSIQETAARRPPVMGPFALDRRATVDESGMVARLVDAAGREGVMVDVGAHHGSSLAPFARAGWRVVACEPDSANRARLVERHGAREGVTILPCAVSSEPAAEAAFFTSEESTGISALHAFRETHREAGKVRVTTVEELVSEHSLERVDYLKIDVEGFDWDVLKGVPWERISPAVIECEFEDRKTIPRGHTYREMADYLVERGYVVYLSEWHPIVRYGVRHQWRQLLRYPARLASAAGWGNILAFRHDPGAEALKAAFTAVLKVEQPTVTELEPVASAVAAAPLEAKLKDLIAAERSTLNSLLTDIRALKGVEAPRVLDDDWVASDV